VKPPNSDALSGSTDQQSNARWSLVYKIRNLLTNASTTPNTITTVPMLPFPVVSSCTLLSVSVLPTGISTPHKKSQLCELYSAAAVCHTITRPPGCGTDGSHGPALVSNRQHHGLGGSFGRTELKMDENVKTKKLTTKV
jgi:hypothetical protein